MATVPEVFERMRARVTANPEIARDLNATYQFDLLGEGGGTWHATFHNGSYDIGEGPISTPGCLITMDLLDFMAMVGGKLNPAAAFMGGKLKLKGDLSLAMKLQALLT